MSIRKGEELNETGLKNFLKRKELIKSADNELVVKQFSTGFSNLTYYLQIEGKEFVCRRPPFGAVKRGHDMSREFKVLSHLKKVFSKVPQVYAFSEGEEVMDVPFYLMEMVKGIILTGKEATKLQVSAADFPIIAETWLDTFVELHQLDYKAAGLEDLGKPEGYVERQVKNWSEQYLKAATDDFENVEKVMHWLHENQPKTYDFSLIHNDYKYDNVVFKDNTWKEITAILDWEMCTLGDPLMDLGTSLAYWILNDDPKIMQKGLDTATLLDGNPKRSLILENYAQKMGKNIDNFVFYYSFGLFKIAVIVQQIYYRYKKGYTSDPRFAHLNIMAETLINTAWKSIQTGKIE